MSNQAIDKEKSTLTVDESDTLATEEKDSLPITKKDKDLLEKFGFTDTNDWTHGEANFIISSIEQNGWRVPPAFAILQDDNWTKTWAETTKPQEKIQQSNDIQSRQSEKVQENVEESTKFYEATSHEKLLPFLNMKASYHESRLNTLSEKRNTRVMKLEKNQMKIQKLTAKAEKYEDMQRFLGTVAEKFPPAKAMMERLRKKTQKIRNEKLPKRQEKVEKHRTRIAAIDRKSMRIGHKLDRSVALSDTIKSFGLTKNRRQVFAESLNRLNQSTRDCLQDQLDVQMRKLMLAKQTYAELGHEQKFSLLEEIQERQEKCNQLQARVDKLSTKIDFTKQQDNAIDAISAKTEKILDEASRDDKMDIPSVSEKICVTGAETVREMEQVQTTEKVAAKPNTREVQNPDLYDSLSAKERYTQRMNENLARETAARLQKAGVEYSAVFDGKKSAVTIRHADYKKAGKLFPSQISEKTHEKSSQEKVQQTAPKKCSPFSRAKLNETAQEIREQKRRNPPEKSQQKKKDEPSL